MLASRVGVLLASDCNAARVVLRLMDGEKRASALCHRLHRLAIRPRSACMRLGGLFQSSAQYRLGTQTVRKVLTGGTDTAAINRPWVVVDGVLRIALLLYFHELGYGPLPLALLLVCPQVFSAITGTARDRFPAVAHFGDRTQLPLLLQIIALAMLILPGDLLTLSWALAAQAISGSAGGLGQREARAVFAASSGGAVPATLSDWFARLSHSGYALQGMGFFLGGTLLSLVGLQATLGMVMAALGALVLRGPRHAAGASVASARQGAPTGALRPGVLSAARLLLGARDVCLAIAVPVHLSTAYGWSHAAVGSYVALWLFVVSATQLLTPWLIAATGYAAARWAALLAAVPLLIAISPGAVSFPGYEMLGGLPLPELSLAGGLLLFAALYAINVVVQDRLAEHYPSRRQDAASNTGLFLPAALGRIGGTVLSGWLYQTESLAACLLFSALCLALMSALLLAVPGPAQASLRRA